MYADVDTLIEHMLAKRQVRERLARDVETKPPPPIVVHCSAGLGRTGTLCALYNIVEALIFSNSSKMFEKLRKQEYYRAVPRLLGEPEGASLSPLRVSIFGCVRKLREQRMKMVKEQCQYQFLYKYIEWWLK